MVINATEIYAFFIQSVFPTLLQLIRTPLQQKEILWTILPLLTSALFVELYFGRYKTEELGWNTAFANCISLLWVTTVLTRFIYEKYGSAVFREINVQGVTPQIILIVILSIWSFTLAITNYFHSLPKAISFFISSTIPVNVTAMVLSLVIIGEFAINATTITAAFLLFISLAIVFATVQALIRPSPEARKYIEAYKKKAAEKKQEREKHFFKIVKQIKERLVAQYLATFATVKGFFKQ